MREVPLPGCLQEYAAHRLTPRGDIQTRWALGHLARALGKTRREELRIGDFLETSRALEAYLLREGYSLKVGREVRYWLRRFQRHLVERKFLPSVPGTAWKRRDRLTASWQRLYDDLSPRVGGDRRHLVLRALAHLGRWATEHHQVPSTLTAKFLQEWVAAFRNDHPREWRRCYAAFRRQMAQEKSGSIGLAQLAWPVPAPRFSADYLSPFERWPASLRNQWTELLEEAAPILEQPAPGEDRRARVWRAGLEAYLGYLVRVRGYDASLLALYPGRRGTIWALRQDNLHRYFDWQIRERRAREPLRSLLSFLDAVRLCFPRPDTASLVAFLREARSRLAERRRSTSAVREAVTAEMLRALPDRVAREAARTDGGKRASIWRRDAVLLAMLTAVPMSSQELADLLMEDLPKYDLPEDLDRVVRTYLASLPPDRRRGKEDARLLTGSGGEPITAQQVRERVRFWTGRLVGAALSPRRFRQLVHAE